MARGTALNIAGQVAPLALAVFAIPWTISELGTARFGVLAIVWALFGYLNLLDLGIGRAVTQSVAERGGRVEGAFALETRGVLIFLFTLGLVLAPAFWALAPVLATLLHSRAGLESEILTTLRLASLAIPFVTSVNGLRGLLEAKQRFDIINAIRLPNAVFNYVSPLVVFQIHPSLGAITFALLAGRVVSWSVYLGYALKVAPELAHQPWALPRLESLRPTMRFAGWIAVSNLVSPLMSGLDRFLLASMVSVSAVTYYATPFEAITRLWILPGALIPVLFPVFTERGSTKDASLAPLFRRSLSTIALVVFPIVAIVIAFSFPILRLWLGTSLAAATNQVLLWLAVGVFVNSVTQVPFALVQALGRPDITAKFHLIELPLFLATFVVLVHRSGALGAAEAWTLRVGVDAILVGLASEHLLKTRFGSEQMRLLLGTLLVSVLVLAAIAIQNEPAWRYGMLAAGTIGYVGTLWSMGLSSADRGALKQLLSGMLRQGEGT